jgi:hypothetical protein
LAAIAAVLTIGAVVLFNGTTKPKTIAHVVKRQAIVILKDEKRGPDVEIVLTVIAPLFVFNQQQSIVLIYYHAQQRK